MDDLTLFYLFRRLLLILIATYSFIRLVHFVLDWQVAARSDDRHEKVVRRYIELSVLRAPLRRFLPDWLQLAVLAVLLVWLISLHP